jgi:hypothetical protein
MRVKIALRGTSINFDPFHPVRQDREVIVIRPLRNLAFCLLAASPAFAQAPTVPPPMGAYRPAPVDTPLVGDARAFVQKHLASMTLGDVTEAYIQVVAGLNVKLVCTVVADDGPSAWEFVAYRSLDGKWHFYSANRI